LYSFNCPTCGEVEKRIPVEERNIQQYCECGLPLTRVFSLTPVKIKTNGRDKILNVLNSEKPGARSQRSQAALAKGLNYEKQTVGIGWGG